MKEFYHDKPDGVIGNEDCGQMSAWYILSSLGFYPVFPASADYVIGSPLFDKATIQLPNGKKFTVETVNNSDKNIYVQSIELNGNAYANSYIHHQDILNGGTIRMMMGDKPNNNFGASMEYRPWRFHLTKMRGSHGVSHPIAHGWPNLLMSFNLR
jgi:putative alpha-1,2-mannosidase